MLQQDRSLESNTGERYNRAARVIAGWIRDSDFADAAGEPSSLPIESTGTGLSDPSFSGLVRRYSGDIPPRAILDELLRVGAVERLKDERIRLLARAYVPRSSDVDKLGILGTDVGDLIQTIAHNLEHGSADPFFQRKVMYDNLPQEALGNFRALSATQAQEFLEQLDAWLAKRDRDVVKDDGGTGRMRAGIGIYYFQGNMQEDREEHRIEQ